MRTSTRRLVLAASAVLAITAAGGAALAQMPPPPPPPPAPPAPPPHPPMHTLMHSGRHGDPEAHAKHLRDVLQLRPDQDAALKAYLEATAPQTMTEGVKWQAQDDDKAPLTTPERLDRQAAHMAKMAETFQKRAVATKAFYAALSPSQRKAFDTLGPRAGGPQMRMRRIETRHQGPGKGGHHEERSVIIRRNAG